MSKDDRPQLYVQLLNEFKKAHHSLTHNQCAAKVGLIWQSLKKQDDSDVKVKEEISKWKLKASEQKLTLDKYWTSLKEKAASSTSTKDFQENKSIQEPHEDKVTSSTEGSQENSASSINLNKPPSTPSQDKLRSRIVSLKSEIFYLESKKSQAMASDEELKQLSKYRKELEDKEKTLKTKVAGQIRQQKKRANDKKVIEQLKESNPDIAAAISKRPNVGRPRIEEQQSELLKTIVDIAIYGSGADDRRRTETIRSVHTLDELTEQLNLKGFSIKRSAVYLRLLPKNSLTTEGKRHIATVPVRLARASNDLHHEHTDTKFCTAAIKYVEEIASVLGPNEVLFLSQDDKARVPIGKTAANKQTPLLMHLKYRVRLPDHDWVVAKQHKLIPSVYAFVKINANEIGDAKAVTYSGPTFITIRSGKHCSSTAYSHSKDFKSLMDMDEFKSFTKNITDEYKPVVIITSDGGPDENPRYEKTINCAIEHFKKYDLDAIFIITNAPGRSAYNRVERRMAPLSRDLAGLILPHESCGSHLNEKGETIDSDLEKKNFQTAGKLLAEVWSQAIIDNYETVAQYILPENSEAEPPEITSAEWKARHVREGHYLLQIVKCSDENCCRKRRSSYFKIMNQFIPAPLCVTQEDDGVKITNYDLNEAPFASLFLRMLLKDDHLKVGTIKEVPFDYSCPSLKDIVPIRTCDCGIYHGTKKSLLQHQRFCKKKNQKDIVRQESKVKSVRPQRIAAKRQNEKMVVWVSRLNNEHVDWFDDDDEDILGLEETDYDQNEPIAPVITIDNLMENPWEL